MSRKDKETIVFVINVGNSGDPGSNKEMVENAKQLLKNIIEKKIFLEPKDEIGIVLMGVDVGVNALMYDNIEDYHPVQVCSWDMVERVLEIVPTDFLFTNWITGLQAGVNLMQREAENSKRKTLVVIMDCPEAEIQQQQMKDIAATIIEEQIALLWVGMSSLLDLGRGERNNSEKMVQRLCRRVDGKHVTFSEMSNIKFYGGKQPKPTGWSCDLEISDIRIPIMAYLYIQDNCTLAPWKTVAQNLEAEDPDEYQTVVKKKALTDYNKTEYDSEDTIRGYKYGRAFVPMTEDLLKELKNKDTKRSLILYGFVPKEKVKLHDRCGDETHMLLPSQGAEVHFFSLLKAMSDLNVAAIVRQVYRDRCNPKVRILYPQVGDGDKPWCFLMIELVFKENISVIEPRTYEEIYRHLKDEEWNAVDNLIDEMMLRDPTAEDEDQRTFEPGTIFSPDTQHVWNRLADRALNPLTVKDPPAHPPADYLMELVSSPKYLQTENLKRCVDRVIEIFELKKEEPVVEAVSVFPDKTLPITQKTDDTGYGTQLSTQNKNTPTQNEFDLDALMD